MSQPDIKQYVFRKGAEKRIPVSGTFELTSRCNLSCKMCYVHMTKDEQSKVGQELTTQEWIALGREAVDAGMVYLLLTGGEPLLRPDFIEIYTSLIQMGLMITVNTNATLLTPEILECFQKYRPEKVNVTLYGMSEETYGDLCGNTRGFDAAIRGILRMKEAGLRVNLNTTFTQRNIADMDRIVAFAKEHHIPVRTAAYVFPPIRNQHTPDDTCLSPTEMGKAAARFDWLTLDAKQKNQRIAFIQKCLNNQPAELEQQSRISSCMAGRGAFWISWDGNMFPCGMLSDYSVNVRSLGFQNAWQETCRWVKDMVLPKECTGCKFQKLCPSCAAVSQTVNHATDQVVPDMCARTEAYIQTLLSFESTHLNLNIL